MESFVAAIRKEQKLLGEYISHVDALHSIAKHRNVVARSIEHEARQQQRDVAFALRKTVASEDCDDSATRTTSPFVASQGVLLTPPSTTVPQQLQLAQHESDMNEILAKLMSIATQHEQLVGVTTQQSIGGSKKSIAAFAWSLMELATLEQQEDGAASGRPRSAVEKLRQELLSVPLPSSCATASGDQGMAVAAHATADLVAWAESATCYYAEQSACLVDCAILLRDVLGPVDATKSDLVVRTARAKVVSKGNVCLTLLRASSDNDLDAELSQLFRGEDDGDDDDEGFATGFVQRLNDVLVAAYGRGGSSNSSVQTERLMSAVHPLMAVYVL